MRGVTGPGGHATRISTGQPHYVDGLTSPADYPDHFHKGVICHSNTITCKGTWKFWCNKEWYGTYAIERRYPEEDWRLLGSSTSRIGAASNLQITGDEAGEECYLRLMLYESQLSNASDPSQGFPADACGNGWWWTPTTRTWCCNFAFRRPSGHRAAVHDSGNSDGAALPDKYGILHQGKPRVGG